MSSSLSVFFFFFFFFNDTATTEIYTLSLHDALPILLGRSGKSRRSATCSASEGETASSALTWRTGNSHILATSSTQPRSEEHTSELQSLAYLVCRLLLEKKKNNRMRK